VQSNAFSGASPGVGSGSSNSIDPLAAGSSQVFASDPDAVEVGFVTTFVVDVIHVVQVAVNNTRRCDL
jgi:hypothetical protein